jgi:type VII secretion protein EccB
VSEKSLAGVQRGLAIGIPGAPDELDPAAGAGLPWAVCSMPKAGDPYRGYTETGLGGALPDALGTATPLPADSGLLVTSPADGSIWLIWHDLRLAVGDPSAPAAAAQPVPAARAVFDGDQPTIAVTSAWLDSVRPGPRLAAPVPQGTIGGTGVQVGGRPARVGQVVQESTPGGQTQYYLVGSSSLTSISVVQARLAEPLYGAAGSQLTATPADIAATKVDATSPDANLPQNPPKLLTAPQDSLAVCTDFTDPQGQAPGHVTTAPVQAGKLHKIAAADPTPFEKPDATLADVADMDPGQCAVVRALNGDKSTGALYLVTSYNGYAVKYPVPDQGTLDVLGFKGVPPLPVPQSLLGLLHTGPRLATADAWGQVAPSGVGAPAASTTAAPPQ